MRESGRVAEPGARAWGDEASDDEQQGEQLTETVSDSALLTQVQDALKRIDNGTYGKCVVDDGQIEEKRLEAEPWPPYCLKHLQKLEGPASIRTPSSLTPGDQQAERRRDLAGQSCPRTYCGRPGGPIGNLFYLGGIR
jgi:RNA polymerase-binding transcription factor DksA